MAIPSETLSKHVIFISPAEENICEALLKHPEGLMAQQLADEIGLARSTITKYLRRRRRVNHLSLVNQGVILIENIPATWKAGTCSHPTHPGWQCSIGTRGRPWSRYKLSAWARADLEGEDKK